MSSVPLPPCHTHHPHLPLRFLHKFAFIQQCFFPSSLRFILFDRSCVDGAVCVRLCEGLGRGDASLPSRPLLPRIGAECEWGGSVRGAQIGVREKKEAPQVRFTPSIMTAPALPHRCPFFFSCFFITATHLSPCHHICIHPACKLQRSLFRERRLSAMMCFQLALAFAI